MNLLKFSSLHLDDTSELQRRLGHSAHNLVWTMLHKLRQTIGIRDFCREL